MKKEILFITLLSSSLTLMNCSPLEDAKDGLDCIDKLSALNEDADYMTCKELTAALNGIEKSCKDIMDDEDRARFQLLRENCED
ncbi:hypothetical protein [Maribacter cobaltidurans]|uniref:Uncharacterized protein n=1 Tax=Maribacter cobaltidurans TaxID=1178778 RepID=A0A223V684_9FLAO|nr:hypothetical protein [Maribacter cobaltidurans]ASV30812.1 hypothetical protein CJ263_11615 [Maribacter cobaltidurans]